MNRHSTELQKPIVLFDGMCNYCSSLINFIARHDTKDRFLFAASQTAAGKQLLQKFSLGSIADETVILIEQDQTFIKSIAVLRIYRKLNGLIPLLYILIIVPRFIRDAVYDFIARNRYKWFGRRDSCMVPDERIKRKFL